MSSRRVRAEDSTPVGRDEPPPAGEAAADPELLRLRVSAPTVDDALRLIDALPDVHAELAPLETSYAVLVEIRRNASPQLARTLDRIDRWLAATGLTTSRIEVDGRAYAAEAPLSPAEV